MTEEEHLVLFLDDPLTVRWLPRFTTEPIMHAGKHYEGAYGGSIFFDCLFDGAQVTGIELHPFDDCEQALVASLRRGDLPPYVELIDGFPVIWLSQSRNGTGRGLEAFSTDYLLTDDHRWGVLLPLGGWLSQDELAALHRLPLQQV